MWLIKTILIIYSLMILPCILAAQGITGTITNNSGEVVPFTNVFVPELNKGTTSNENGIYQLPLPAGAWIVEYRNIGYATLEKAVRIDSRWVEMPVLLTARTYRLSEIKVLASGEDPAMYIMRRAISMAPYYKNQVSKYSSSVYLKGTGKFGKIPKLFKNRLEKEGVKVDYVFSMESFSKVNFELPDRLKQTVIAQRSSGSDNNTSPMQMITTSLYNTSQYGVVSPFDKQALQLYSFKLLGMFEDQGRMVNRIHVSPKRKSKDLFEGIINIFDGFWSIHSADLTINPTMMKARMKQIYGAVDKNTWMPVSLTFDINFNGMGFDFDYTYVSTISDYSVTLNPKLDHSFIEKQQKILADEARLMEKTDPSPQLTANKFDKPSKNQAQINALLQTENLTTGEARKLNKLLQKEAVSNQPPPPLQIEERVFVDPDAADADSTIWSQIRPIPLTEKEQVSYKRKDSLMVIRQQPAWRDSAAESRYKFKLRHLLVGKTYSYHPQRSEKRNTLTIPGISGLLMTSFNTVEGIKLNFPFTWYTRDTLGHSFTLKPEVGYAIARNKPVGQFFANYQYFGLKRASVGFSAGNTTSDFNHKTGMPTFVNDIMTLWFERNFKKFYQHNFLALSHQIEIVNGMMFGVNVSWADRKPLNNYSERLIIDWKDRAYTPNIPVNSTLQNYQLDASKSTELKFDLTWTPNQRYYLRNGFKMPVAGKYPTFNLSYNKGITGILGSNTNFDLLQTIVYQRVISGIGNIFAYKLSAGGFLNSKRLYFADYRHFNTDYAELIADGNPQSFKLLPYYAASTDRFFAEGHASFESGRFMLKRLPMLTNTMLAEQVSIRFLHNNIYRYYTELGYSINYIFALLNLEAVVSFENGKYRSAGIKVGLKLTP